MEMDFEISHQNQPEVNDHLKNISHFEAYYELRSYCAKFYQSTQRIITRDKLFNYFKDPEGKRPLDFIEVYKNEGDIERRIPQHWHYIGYGLTDIYNYVNVSQIHNYPDIFPPKTKNGFGFELTFRLKCNSQASWDKGPPRWPEEIMQRLAHYVFTSKNVLNVGDHIDWNRPLDSERDESDQDIDIDRPSNIQGLVMALDPQLKVFGKDKLAKKFIQIVGVFKEEIEYARQWQGIEILNKMRVKEETGGELLVTDMARCQSIIDLDHNILEDLKKSISTTGSSMAKLSTLHKYSSVKPVWFDPIETLHNGDRFADQEYVRLLDSSTNDSIRVPSRASTVSDSNLEISNLEMAEERPYYNIYLLFNYEAAKLFPIVLNCRLRHKRPFTYTTFKGDLTTSFIPEGYDETSSFVSRERPFVRQGPWLQIYISNELLNQMQMTLEPDFGSDCEHEEKKRFFKNYSWPEHRLYISVASEFRDSD